MEIYGLTGAIYADNKNDLRLRISEGYDGYSEEFIELDDRTPPFDDPFAFFAAVVKNEIRLEPYDLSSLENNMIVMEILDAAVKSAQSKKTIEIKN